MSKFWKLFMICVILVGSLMNPLSNTNTSKALLNVKDDVSVCTVGYEGRNLITKEIDSFDKGLFIYYKPLHINYETPHIQWERKS